MKNEQRNELLQLIKESAERNQPNVPGLFIAGSKNAVVLIDKAGARSTKHLNDAEVSVAFLVRPSKAHEDAGLGFVEFQMKVRANEIDTVFDLAAALTLEDANTLSTMLDNAIGKAIKDREASKEAA